MKTVRFLFNDDMARAIVQGRKTVTRRPVAPREFGPTMLLGCDWCFRARRGGWNFVSTTLLLKKFAPCAPGDILIGRECFSTDAVHYDATGTDDDGTEAATAEFVYYRATPREGLRRWIEPKPAEWERPARITYLDESTPLHCGPASRVKSWRPSIHMPDWAARIRRRVVSVTVERLQDITEDDAVREGFATSEELEEFFRNCAPPGSRMARPLHTFEVAWDGIYAAKGLGWDSNCWVWRIEFERENVQEVSNGR